MGNVHESLLKSLNQRKVLIFWCTRFLQNSWQNQVRRTHRITPWHHSFVSQQGCNVFVRQNATIFIFIPEVLGVCSMDSSCSTIWTVIQIEWPVSCASTTSVSILHTIHKKESEINTTSAHSMSILIRQQAPLHLGSTWSCCWEKEFGQEQGKLSRFEDCRDCGYAIGWGPWRNHHLAQKNAGYPAYPGWTSKEIRTDWGSRSHLGPVTPHVSLQTQFYILLSLGGGKDLSKRELVVQRRWAALTSKVLVAPRKRSCDLQERLCFDSAETEYLQVWRCQCNNSNNINISINSSHNDFKEGAPGN